MSAFDPENFLHQEVEGALETRLTPVDEGDYEGCYIDNIIVEAVKTANGPTPLMYVVWTITDEDVKQALGLEKVTVRQSIWLDLDENGALEMGPNKNTKLGQIREAVSQNADGSPWSPGMLIGEGPCTIKVGHRYNKETGEGPYAEVRKVVAG